MPRLRVQWDLTHTATPILATAHTLDETEEMIAQPNQYDVLDK